MHIYYNKSDVGILLLEIMMSKENLGLVFSKDTVQKLHALWVNQAWACDIFSLVLEEYIKEKQLKYIIDISFIKDWAIHKYETSPYDEFR